MKRIGEIFIVVLLIIQGIVNNISDSLTKRYRPKRPPAYLLYAGADNGFVASYRAYFALDGDRFEPLSEKVYYKTKRTWGYESFRPELSNINVTAENDDTTKWVFRSVSGREYDRERLIDLIKNIGIERTKYFFLEITELDGYMLVYACNTDRDGFGTVLGQHSALFRDGRRIDLPQKTQLICFREFYRSKVQA